MEKVGGAFWLKLDDPISNIDLCYQFHLGNTSRLVMQA